jgi:hypothetical protein
MAADISLIVGNTNPPVIDSVATYDTTTENGTPVDLTGSSVKFYMRLQTSSDLKVDEDATIVGDPTLGNITYLWTTDDVDTAGAYAGWFTVTFGDSTTQDTPEFTIRILDHAPLTDGYTTVAAVRDYLGKESQDGTQDEVIADLIVRYSRAVDNFCQVSFAFEGNATKTFAFKGGTVSFSRYGLSAATDVVLSPENSSSTLTANVDYILMPLNKENGCYTSMEVSAFSVPSYVTYDRFGKMFVSVTGDWGMETIPYDLEYAVIRAVAQAIRRDVSLSTQAVPDDGAGNLPVFLPADVRAALQSYRRYGY